MHLRQENAHNPMLLRYVSRVRVIVVMHAGKWIRKMEKKKRRMICFFSNLRERQFYKLSNGTPH